MKDNRSCRTAREVRSDYIKRLNEFSEGILVEEIEALIRVVEDARSSESTIFLAGNGGSASTSNHIALDWTFGSGVRNPGIRAVSLAESISTVTATGNDDSFEAVFSRQLEALAKSGDVVIAISASGRSPNLLRLFASAERLQLKRVAITGFDGGVLRKLADVSVHVPTEIGEYGVCEDLHLAIGHLVKEYFLGVSASE